MANRCFIKRNGTWQPLRPKKKVNGQWVDCPAYLKENGQWVRIDQQLVTKTKVIEGYAQWNGSWRNSSGTGGASHYRSDNIYQGKYNSYHYLGLMCFTDLFNDARNTGTITKVELRLKNNHAYYNTGLKTKICGAWSLPSTSPTTAYFDWSDSNAYTGEWHFGKNAASPQWITLDSKIHNAIQNGSLNGLRLLSPSGFSLNDYGYFEGSNENRPYIKITVQYQVWE